jgi:hypothetical protein
MKTLLAAAFLALALPAPARAQVQFQIQLGLPVTPPLVVVQPGIQVVRDYDEEVFFHGNRYWLRRGRHWYWAPGPSAPFVHVEPQAVPAPLMRLPPGRYVRYHVPPGHEWREREERKAWKEREKESRKAWKHREHEEAKARHEQEKERRRPEPEQGRRERPDRHGDRD